MTELPAGEPVLPPTAGESESAVTAPPIPPPPPQPYPGLVQALGLVVLVQVIANFAAALVYVARYLSGVPLERLMELDASELGAGVNSLAFGLVIAFAARRSRRPARENFPLRGVSPAQIVPMILTLGGALLVVNEISGVLLRLLPVPKMFQDLFGNILVGWFAPVFLVLVAPVTEELLFRGVFLRGFRERYDDTKAIVWSAVFFGGIHLLPWQVVPAFCLGLVFAWWTIRSRSLWPALIGHAITNGTSWWQSRSLDDPTQAFTASSQPLWLTLAGVAALFAGLYVSSRLFRRAAGTDLKERSLS